MRYCLVPKNLIYNNDLDEKRIMIYCYFYNMKSINYNQVGFSLNDIVSWCGLSPNSKQGKTNDSIINVIKEFEDIGYFEKEDFINRKCGDSFLKLTINNEYFYPQDDYFAIIYEDEIEKIREITSISPSYVLLLLSYLRCNIKRGCTYGDTFYATYKDILDDMKICKNTLTKSLTVLNDLGIIYSELSYRFKCNGEWITGNTIFTNKYRRSKNGKPVTNYSYLEEVKKTKIKLTEKFSNKLEDTSFDNEYGTDYKNNKKVEVIDVE